MSQPAYSKERQLPFMTEPHQRQVPAGRHELGDGDPIFLDAFVFERDDSPALGKDLLGLASSKYQRDGKRTKNDKISQRKGREEDGSYIQQGE